MARDITLIGHFGQWQTLFFFQQLADVDKDFPGEQLVLRVNSQGGHPQESQSIIEKAQEIIERVQALKGNAQMHSTALFLYAYFPVEICECLDTTQGVLHRAAYDEDFEKWSGFKGSMWEQISIKLNNDMQRAFRNRVDVEALEALPQMKANNITLKSIFDMSTRVSVVLTGADMKKIGLVSKINKITPARATAMAAEIQMFEKCNSLKEYKLAAMASKKEEEETPTTMTLEELKAKFPAVYAEAKKEGVTEEKERVEAIMVFADIDPAAAKLAIESGKPLSAKQMAEFSRKSMSASVLASASIDSAEEVATETAVDEEEEVAEQTAAEKVATAKAKPAPVAKGKETPNPVKSADDKKKITDFEAALDARLGLKKAS